MAGNHVIRHVIHRAQTACVSCAPRQGPSWCSTLGILTSSADAASVPAHIASKAAFYEHVQLQVDGLLDGQTNWVTNLANVSSILYSSMNRFEAWRDKRVNWAGFYLLAPLFPGTRHLASLTRPMLWLGPFCGLPACQAIPSERGRGVCADGSAQWPPAPLCVPHTDAYRTS